MLPTTARKAGPYSCNGSVVDFDFAFKVYTTDDIRVVKTTSAGVESDLTLTSQYTVVLNADQDNDPGGTVTTVSTYATGNKITVVGDTDYGQPTDITNRGGFYPDVIMKMVDRAVIMCQQLKEGLDRAVKVDVSSTVDPADLLDDITDSVAAAAASQSAAGASASAASASQIAAAASAVSAAASAASVDITTPSGNAIVLRSTAPTDVTLPTSGTLARTADKLSVFAATTSSELAGVISDETGSGALVFANTPTLATPNIGAATGTSLALTAGLTTGDGTVSAPGFAFGSDPDNGAYRIGTNNWALACAGAKVMEFNPGGEITMPLQPAFSAYNSSTRTNVTGDGTNVTLAFDTTIFNRGSGYSTGTDTFTAPVTGIYDLKAGWLLTGLDNDPTALNGQLVTSNRTYNTEVNSSAFPVGNYQMEIQRLCDMDAGDTAVVKTQVYKAPSSLSANVYGNATNYYTIFQGHLAC